MLIEDFPEVFLHLTKKNLAEPHAIYFVTMRYCRFVFTSFLIIKFGYLYNYATTRHHRSPSFFVFNDLSLNSNLIHPFQ